MVTRLVFRVILVYWLIKETTGAPPPPPIAKPGCQTSCGSIMIPYPFGIGPNCYANHSFAITCTNSTPFLSSINIEVLEISLKKSTIRVNGPVTVSDCPAATGGRVMNLSGTPFSFSQTYNRFTGIGCNSLAQMFDTTITRGDQGESAIGECMSTCSNGTAIHNTSRGGFICYGINCCQTAIPPSLKVLNVSLSSISNSSSPTTTATDDNQRGECKYGFMVEQDWFNNLMSPFAVHGMVNVPVVLDWTTEEKCYLSEMFDNYDDYYYDNWISHNRLNNGTCHCPPGSEGNPYLRAGCQEPGPPPIAKPGCQTSCGSITIPYPFGIGPNCYANHSFAITCNNSRPFLSSINLEVLEIPLRNSTIRVNGPVTVSNCPAATGGRVMNLSGTPFSFSQTSNRFIGIGCNSLAQMFDATITRDDQGESAIGECMSTCSNGRAIYNTRRGGFICYGINCCQTAIPPSLKVLNVSLSSISMTSTTNSSSPTTTTNDNQRGGCKYGFIVEQDWFNNLTSPFDVQGMVNVPIVLDWTTEEKCYLSEIFDDDGYYYFEYSDWTLRNPGKCACPRGYEGNAYLPYGCKDIDECEMDPNPCGEHRICDNRSGGYSCSGPESTNKRSTLMPVSVGPLPVAKRGCLSRCGSIMIPYPFGIGPNCCANHSFAITCKNSGPFLSSINLEVLGILLENSTIRVNSPVTVSDCSAATGGRVINLLGTPFSFSQTSNHFTGIGCNNLAQMFDLTSTHVEQGDSAVGVCRSECSSSKAIYNNRGGFTCYGINCCQTAIPPSLKVLNVSLSSISTTSTTNSSSPTTTTNDNQRGGCKYGFMVEQDWFNNLTSPFDVQGMVNVPVVLDWTTEEKSKRNLTLVSVGIGSGLGGLLLITGTWWLWKIIKRRKKAKLKKKFFKRNGGLLLQQQLTSAKQGHVEKTKVFTAKELEKATDHYNENRILGHGGQGTVYKGMLIDGKIVAVKKSKVVDEGKLEEFINEVVILSQINHRNVVKLHGCCLETEVPLLVYDFIQNGTLFEYIHRRGNDDFSLSWEVRLRIASEAAEAMAYLHSAASVPIYHRDIKSTNILLDDKYRAKVADFGTSRSATIDQTHMTTKVQGTFGYLDPEYFQSSQFTAKSDVYSFGVVLLELLTGQKAVLPTTFEEGRSLATFFMLNMKENRLFDILDAQVVKEGGKGDIIQVANLARRCLNLNGKKRPTMKEVAMELEAIRASLGASSSSFQECYEEEVDDLDIIDLSSPWDKSSTSTTFYVEDKPLLLT